MASHKHSHLLFLHHYVGHKRERIAYAPGNSRSFRGMDPGGDLHGNIRSGTIRKVFQTQERQEGFRRLRGRAGTVRKAFQSQNQSQKRFVGDRSIRDRSLRSIRVRSILFRARILHGFKTPNVFSPRRTAFNVKPGKDCVFEKKSVIGEKGLTT